MHLNVYMSSKQAHSCMATLYHIMYITDTCMYNVIIIVFHTYSVANNNNYLLILQLQ